MERMVSLLPSQSDRVPPPPLSGPASHTRGLHLLVLKDVTRMWGVFRHIVPRDTDTPYSTCYSRYLEKTAIACGRLISVSVTRTLLRVASFRARPRKTGDTGCSEQTEEALGLMGENKAQGHTEETRYYYCEINHLFGGAPCVEAAKETVDSLVLCERHALEAKLEGQIACWGEMLFHIDLWSREASRRKREDVVGLLEDQRIQATSARNRAYADLDTLRSETPWEPREHQQPPTRRGSLLFLPPRGARPLSGGLRRHRRR